MLPQAASLSLAAAEEDFCRRYPEYQATRALDDLRATEYARLDRDGHVYLDYTGGGLYAETQVRAHETLLLNHTFGNPHSSNPTSLAATELVEGARRYILEYFNAAPQEYAVVFTHNASGALKLVGEAYPFQPGGNYLLTFDNHNSVNGIREFARAKGATVTYAPVLPPDLRLDAAKLAALLNLGGREPKLFAYPAQSNFSGATPPASGPWSPGARRSKNCAGRGSPAAPSRSPRCRGISSTFTRGRRPLKTAR